MTRYRAIAWVIAPLVAMSSAEAMGQSRGHSGGGAWQSHHVAPGHRRGGYGVSPVGINPGYGGYGGPIGAYGYPTLIGYGYGSPAFFGAWGPYGAAPLIGAGPIMPPMAFGPTFTMPPLLPVGPPRRSANPNSNPAAGQPANRDATRSKELMTLGDRLFRAGNYVRAVERYEQAIRADPDLAAPRARLAQVALVRGKYKEAANKLREAQAAEPGWLALAGDVQALYPEPADFARHVARLEAHLQAQPEDRDGWLVLGALWYLSGRTQKAADVFLRLSDRREDPTLRTFLSATKAGE